MQRNSFHVGGTLASLGLLALVASSAPAAGAVVNVDFNSSSGTSGTYSGTGAAPDSGTFWNGVAAGGGSLTASFTSGALTASDGTTATGITVSLGNFNTFDAGTGTPAAKAPALLDDFVYQQTQGTGGPNSTFSIQGLDPSKTYSLYLYSQNANFSETQTIFTIGGVSQTVTNTPGGTGPASFIQNTNYALYSNLSPNGLGVIAGTFNDAKAADNAAFNGLQIVSTPEPATGLLSLVAGGLALLRRRGRPTAAVQGTGSK